MIVLEEEHNLFYSNDGWITFILLHPNFSGRKNSIEGCPPFSYWFVFLLLISWRYDSILLLGEVAVLMSSTSVSVLLLNSPLYVSKNLSCKELHLTAEGCKMNSDRCSRLLLTFRGPSGPLPAQAIL